MDVVSFFAGCGGLDLGFEQAGFKIIWANEFDKTIHDTYRKNHPNTILNTEDIRNINIGDIPDCDGFIGGPPCQSWSEAGKGRGLDDERGMVFLNYVNLIGIKKPKFFVIENVRGILEEEHACELKQITDALKGNGYRLYIKLLDSTNYGVPQDRYRVIFVGIREDIDVNYNFPEATYNVKITLRQAIGDLPGKANTINKTDFLTINNHDSYIGEWTPRFLSRNRVRGWNDVSYTIPATASNVLLHPSVVNMAGISSKQRLELIQKNGYRRLSVRECARIQTFPDSFKFVYRDMRVGYKMVGNAVPPRLGKAIAQSIINAFGQGENKRTVPNHKDIVLVGSVRSRQQRILIFEKHLYYIRADQRFGAMQMDAFKDGITHVLLHQGKMKWLFPVVSSPIYVDEEYLRDLGFEPHGSSYIAVKLGNQLPLIHELLENTNFRNTSKPYLETSKSIRTINKNK